MVEKVSKFRFKDFKIYSSSIEIKEGYAEDRQLEINLNPNGNVNKENGLYEIVLDVYVCNKTKSIEIKTILKGFFEFDNDLSDEAKDNFFNVNGPAILFPYLRAYITALTSLSGIIPIILPTINLAKKGK